MSSERIDIDLIISERRRAVAQSLKPLSVSEASVLCDTIFPSLEHPWRERFQEFLSDNPGELFYHASFSDDGQILYSSSRERGIWFIPNTGVGVLQPKALDAIAEIIVNGA